MSEDATPADVKDTEHLSQRLQLFRQSMFDHAYLGLLNQTKQLFDVDATPEEIHQIFEFVLADAIMAKHPSTIATTEGKIAVRKRIIGA